MQVPPKVLEQYVTKAELDALKAKFELQSLTLTNRINEMESSFLQLSKNLTDNQNQVLKAIKQLTKQGNENRAILNRVAEYLPEDNTTHDVDSHESSDDNTDDDEAHQAEVEALAEKKRQDQERRRKFKERLANDPIPAPLQNSYDPLQDMDVHPDGPSRSTRSNTSSKPDFIALDDSGTPKPKRGKKKKLEEPTPMVSSPLPKKKPATTTTSSPSGLKPPMGRPNIFGKRTQ